MDFKLIIIILILTLLITIVLYNIMLKKKNGIINAYSSLDVILKKRYDLIPNLVSCIKGYIEYEREVITDITSLRKKGMLSTESMDVFEINNELSSDLEKIMLICENYPDLKASENFLKLQAILNDVEENISAEFAEGSELALEQAHQRGFSGTRCTHQHSKIAGFDSEADVFDDRHLRAGIAETQIFDFNDFQRIRSSTSKIQGKNASAA